MCVVLSSKMGEWNLFEKRNNKTKKNPFYKERFLISSNLEF